MVELVRKLLQGPILVFHGHAGLRLNRVVRRIVRLLRIGASCLCDVGSQGQIFMAVKNTLYSAYREKVEGGQYDRF